MYIVIGILVFFVIFIIRFVNSSVVDHVKRLKNVDEFLEPVSSINDVEFIEAYKETEKWAEKDFVFETFFLFHSQNTGVPIKGVSWWSEKYHCYLLFYLAEDGKIINKVTDFYTNLEPEASLTTASSIDGLLLPRIEKDFIQCIIDASLTEQFNQHITSTKSIVEKYKLHIIREKFDLFPRLRKALKDQADHVTELVFWKHSGFYWHFVKKHLIKYRIY